MIRARIRLSILVCLKDEKGNTISVSSEDGNLFTGKTYYIALQAYNDLYSGTTKARGGTTFLTFQSSTP